MNRLSRGTAVLAFALVFASCSSDRASGPSHGAGDGKFMPACEKAVAIHPAPPACLPPLADSEVVVIERDKFVLGGVPAQKPEAKKSERGVLGLEGRYERGKAQEPPIDL